MDKYYTARIDVKNNGADNSVEIFEVDDVLSSVKYPKWMVNKKGKGCTISSKRASINFKIKCIKDGKLIIKLRGPHIRDANRKEFPVYIDITNFNVNGEEVFSGNKLVSHSQPYSFDKEVKDGEIIVYQYGKKVEIKDSNKAVVTTSETEYNSNFEFLPSLVNTVLSVDQDNSPEMAALLGSSLALTISDIPFDGPVAGVIVGKIGKEYIINPTVEQSEQSEIHLTVAGTKDAICMVEAGAKQVSEKDMLGALMFGHEHIKMLCEFQEKIREEIGKEKVEVELAKIDEELEKAVREFATERMYEALSSDKKKLEKL